MFDLISYYLFLSYNFYLSFLGSIITLLIKGKLQITPLKFGGVWILHQKVSEFGFYS